MQLNLEIITCGPSNYTMNHPKFIVSNQKEESIRALGLKYWYVHIKFHYRTVKKRNYILIDFSLTVKAATLIFISGRVSAISSAKQGKSGSILIWSRIKKLFGPRKRACIS